MIYYLYCLNYKHPAINVQWIRLQNPVFINQCSCQLLYSSTITGNEKEFQHLMFWFHGVCLSPLSVPCL